MRIDASVVHMRLGLVGQVVALAAMLMASGCMGGGCVGANSASQGQAAVCNKTDSFAYGMNTGMTTKSESFTWKNTQDKASVAWGSNVAQGSVSIRLLDADGKQVFSKSYGGTGQAGTTESTLAGQSGDWTIKIDLKGVTGQVGITINAS